MDIKQLLNGAKTIAIVGISAKTDRPSYQVAAYLQAAGYKIIPINPAGAGTHILGELCYKDIVDFHQRTGTHIDIVDCFRKSDDIPPIVEQAIQIGATCLWMQLGIVNEAAKQKAEQGGLLVVMDKCTKIEHAELSLR